MRFWFKSSKKEKLQIISEEKGGRPGTSLRHYTDTGLEDTNNYSVKYNPLPSLQASRFRCSSGRSLAQSVPPQGGLPHTTHLVDSSIGRSKRAGQERGFPPTLPGSFFEPDHTVDTPDGKYIDMQFRTVSATNCPSSSRLKKKSPIPSRKKSRRVMRSSSSPNVLNMHTTPPMPTSFNAPNLSVSTHLVTPGRAVQKEPLIKYGFGSRESHANTFLPRSGQSSTPGSSHIYGQRQEPSYRLPLPPVPASSSAPGSPSYSTRANSQVLHSAVEADNNPSPGPRWKKGRLIGNGTFGHVYLGFNSESGDMCAMKEVTIYAGDRRSRESAEQLGQEIALLSQLNHPNIVQYYGTDMVADNLYIYLEYVSGGSIHRVLREYGPLGDGALRNFTRQILSGLAYLHAKNTVHRDVKGANILLQAGGCVKLADFGMAKHISGESSPMSFKGSPYWIAPEVIKHDNADVSVDIWSLGCTVLEMATGSPPWSQYEGVAALFKIANSNELPLIPDELSEEGKDFVRKCLQRDPSQRPTAAQLLEHPFVKFLTPLERHIPSPEPVEAKFLATITGNPQSRNPNLDSGAIHETRGSRNVTPIRNSRNTCAPRMTPILTPRGASESSIPIGAGMVRPSHHRRAPEHIIERLSSPISSPKAASGSLEHLAGSNVSSPFYSKISAMNIHGDQVSTSRQGNSSSSSANTYYQDVNPDMIRQVPQAPLSQQATPSSVQRDRTGTNAPGHPTDSELAHRVSQQLPGEHVKFNYPA